MATAEQIKALIRSHVDDDGERFFTHALQVAAHEARQGHSGLAHEIKTLVDRAKIQRKQSVVKFPNELNGLILNIEPSDTLAKLILGDYHKVRIDRILSEYRQRSILKQHGMNHRRKLLLSGPPGTGKTLTASVIARELGLPLRTIQVDRLVTKFMGETAAKLRQIFDVISDTSGVFLFDEFDAIGGDRGRENDVGEMRRVLNSFLQFIEADKSDNIIIGATNHSGLLDRALFRRFDDVLNYSLPDERERKRLMRNLLAVFTSARFPFVKAVKSSEGLSHADIDSACRDTIKGAILASRSKISITDLQMHLEEKKHIYS